MCKLKLLPLALAFAATTAITLPTTGAPVDLRQGLVAYWPLDETPDGLNTPDLSPFGNHLQLVNMDSANFVPGQRGNAAQFNGTDELLTRIYDPVLNNGFPVSPTRKFTVSFWVNGVGAVQQDRRVFSEGSTAAAAQLFNLGTDSANNTTVIRTNVLDLFVRNDANTAVANHRKSTNMVFDGTWHHVAYVQDETTVRLYIDGVLDAADFNHNAGTVTFNTVSLGAIQRATPAAYYAGLIDDTAVWERPLSQAEVQEFMNNGLTTPIPEYPPLLLTDPVGATISLGDNYTFTARAVGNRPVSYQWLKDGTEIPGATAATYQLLGATADSAGAYAVRVSNFEGFVDSAVAQLTVVPDPPADLQQGLISYWPMDTIADETQSTPDLYSQNDFRLTFIGSLDLVPGSTDLGNAIQFDGFSQYGVRGGGFPAYNSTNHSVSFWVKGNGPTQLDLRVLAESSTNSNNPLFTFGTQPTPGGTSMRVFIRGDAGNTVLAQNTTLPVFDDNWHHIVWSDSNGVARLYVDGVQDPANFRYTRTAMTLNTTAIGAIVRAAVGNFINGAIDEVAVWNRAITFTEVQEIYANRVPPPTMVIPPEITKQPVGADVFAGSDVVLGVEAIGSALQYQWRKDGNDVLDATNSVLVLTSATADQSGVYTVFISNSAGSQLSDPATVVVTAITDATTGLVAYWPFDAVNGATTPDTSGNGNDLTLVNMDASNLVAGPRGNALSFNGTDELAVRFHESGSVHLPAYANRAFTVAMWVNGLGNAQPTAVNNGDRRVFSESSTTNNSPLVNVGTDNGNASTSADIYIRDDAGGNPINHLKSVNPAFDGNWRHLVYVDDNGAGRIYVDGILDPTAINYTRTAITPNVTSIGGIVRAAQSHWFQGTIDDVAVWRRALSDAEVMYVMNNGAVPPPQLKIEQISASESLVILTFTVPDPLSFYCLQETSDLNNAVWTDVTNFALIGPTGNTYEAQIPREPGAQKFYRVYHCP